LVFLGRFQTSKTILPWSIKTWTQKLCSNAKSSQAETSRRKKSSENL